MKNTWQLQSTKIPQNTVELEELMLGLRKIQELENFFQPDHPSQLEPTKLGIDPTQLKTALKILTKAHQQQLPIVVFGDYDADGICATSIMWRTLYDLGYKITPFIPNRQEHGYGLSVKSAQAVVQALQPKLVITVDNGIVANQAVNWLKQQQIQVIITDHHQPELDKNGQISLPVADAILQTDQVCGAGVAWLVAKAVATSNLDDQLDLCALATIADQVPLVGANRSFAYWGIQALRNTKRPGLVALFNRAGISQAEIDEGKISFGLAPRINALGRLAQGIEGVRLLCTNSTSKAQLLASQLDELNSQRQDITQTAIDLAENQLKDQHHQHLLFVYSPDFHEGVIGLVAGKLSERYHRPTVVLGGDGAVIKASARSISGVNITEFIRQIKSDLVDVGGHFLAAGFSVEKSKIGTIKTKLQKLAIEQIAATLLLNNVAADCVLSHSMINVETFLVVQKFAPFGQANREPLFIFQNLNLISSKLIGREDQHLKLILKTSDSRVVTALFWRNGHQQQSLVSGGTKLNVLAKISANEWKGKITPQLEVVDLEIVH